jgi:hypothetical protein
LSPHGGARIWVDGCSNHHHPVLNLKGRFFSE